MDAGRRGGGIRTMEGGRGGKGNRKRRVYLCFGLKPLNKKSWLHT